MEALEEMLRNAIEGGNIDSEALESVAIAAKDPNIRIVARKALLPCLVEAVTVRDELVSEIPAILVPALTEGATFGQILECISHEQFERALSSPQLQPLCVRLLCKATKDEICKYSGFVEDAMKLLADEKTECVGDLENLFTRIVSLGCIDLVNVPYKDLYNGSAELQTRLMALNLIILSAGKYHEFQYLTWSLDTSDILLLSAQVGYIVGALTIVKPKEVPEIVERFQSQINEVAHMYVMNKEPLIQNDIENVFVNLARLHPEAFVALDNKFSLIAENRISLIARIPPLYTWKSHADVIEKLELNSHTVSAYCNLATENETYRMLKLNRKSVERLSFDLRVQLIAAATMNKEVADHFVASYLPLVEQALLPSMVEEIAIWQKTIIHNLGTHRIRVSPQTASVSAGE